MSDQFLQHSQDSHHNWLISQPPLVAFTTERNEEESRGDNHLRPSSFYAVWSYISIIVNGGNFSLPLCLSYRIFFWGCSLVTIIFHWFTSSPKYRIWFLDSTLFISLSFGWWVTVISTPLFPEISIGMRLYSYRIVFPYIEKYHEQLGCQDFIVPLCVLLRVYQERGKFCFLSCTVMLFVMIKVGSWLVLWEWLCCCIFLFFSVLGFLFQTFLGCLFSLAALGCAVWEARADSNRVPILFISIFLSLFLIYCWRLSEPKHSGGSCLHPPSLKFNDLMIY